MLPGSGVGGDPGEPEEWVGRAQGAHFKIYLGPPWFKQSSSSSLIIPLTAHSAGFFP